MKILLIPHDEVVVGDKNMERRLFGVQVRWVPVFAYNFSILGGSPIRQDLYICTILIF